MKTQEISSTSKHSSNQQTSGSWRTGPGQIPPRSWMEEPTLGTPGSQASNLQPPDLRQSFLLHNNKYDKKRKLPMNTPYGYRCKNSQQNTGKAKTASY
jgi:hypothetical protein